MSESTPDLAEQRIRAALSAASVPKIYFNGFVNGMTGADVMCVLERNSEPVGVLNMSFTAAKSLAVALGQIVAALESQAKREIMTTDDIDQFMTASRPAAASILAETEA